jgi:hypothetical protein
VLIPCWNAADSIERAVRSVFDEAGPDLECIVVDDASTDGTAEVLARMAAEDARIVVITLAVNGGVSEARNRGLAAVRGEWLMLVDADDRMLPGGLSALVAAIADPAVRAVVGQQVWADGKRTWVHELYDIPDIRERGRKSLAGSPGLLYYVSPHAKLLHRSTWDGLRFSGRVLGDQPWVIRALLRAGDGIEVLGETVYEWWRPPGQTETSITARTRSSADRGVVAAAVAEEAFAAVADEANARLSGPDRDAVVGRYFERLIRSDLAFHVDKALRRKDPSLGLLVDAVARFVWSVPPARARAGVLLAGELLMPMLKRWNSLDRASRRAYWELAAAAYRNDPRVLQVIPPGRNRVAIRAERWTPRAFRGVGARVVLGLARRLARLRGRRPG